QSRSRRGGTDGVGAVLLPGEETQAQPAAFDDARCPGLGPGRPGADVGDAQAVEDGAGRLQATGPAVEDVVGGEVADIDAGEGRGQVETGDQGGAVPAVGGGLGGDEGRFEVGEDAVGAGEDAAQAVEGGA